MSAVDNSAGGTAILGTSPLMLVLADHLTRTTEVTIIEERDEVGGAWSRVNFDGHHYNAKTNIIVPLSLDEEPVILEINRLLAERFGVIATKSGADISMLSGYAPLNRFSYDLQPLFDQAATWRRLSGRVERVVVDGPRVKLAGSGFARAYLPYFAGISEIEVDGERHATPFSEIVSEHILMVLNGHSPERERYCEEFNEVFDRVQISKSDRELVFTGRIARAHKGKDADWLVAQAAGLFPTTSIRHASINKYRNCFRNEEQLNALRRATAASSRLNLIDTSQFVASFNSLLPTLKAAQ